MDNDKPLEDVRWRPSDSFSSRHALSKPVEPGRKRKRTIDDLRNYLALHPAARHAFEGYMRGEYRTVPEAAEAGCSKFPQDIKPSSVRRFAEQHGWNAMRKLYAPRVNAAADKAALAEMEKVNAVIGEYEAALVAMKPESPNNPKARLDWLLKLRDKCRETLLNDPGGASGAHTYKLLGQVEADIEAICRPDEDGDDRPDYKFEIPSATLEEVLTDIKVPEGYVGPDLAATIEAQMEAQQKAWREQP